MCPTQIFSEMGVIMAILPSHKFPNKIDILNSD